MLLFLNFVQIGISVLLIIAILLQQRGGGLSPILGGEGGVYRTRRGAERMIFIATIVLSILFLASAVINILIR